MSRHNSGNKTEESAILIVLLILVFAFGGILLDRSRTRSAHHDAGAETVAKQGLTRRDLNRINESLQSADLKMQLQKSRVQIENSMTAKGLDTVNLASTQADREDLREGNLPREGLDLVPEDRAAAVYQAEHVQNKRYDISELESERINRNLANRQYVTEYDRMLNSAYTNQFLQNALRDGYAIQLNAQGEVIKVQRIQQPQPLRFPQSTIGATSGGI